MTNRLSQRGPGGRTGTVHRIVAALGIAFLTVLGSLAGAAPASAHNVLISSDPADGATVDTALAQVSFTFDQPIENFDPALKVFGPGGNEFTTAPPTVAGSTISAPVELGSAGAYRAAYRIVSSDGHPVTGQITFTVTGAAAGTATGTPSTGGAGAGVTTAVSSSGNSGGIAAWVWILVGAAVVVLVVAAVIVAVRPRGRG
jgi:methionine-rich copper-binding protein CopC